MADRNGQNGHSLEVSTSTAPFPWRSAPAPPPPGRPEEVAPGWRNKVAAYREMVLNYITSRVEMIKRWLDPRRNLDYELGYPEGYVSPALYQYLYEREAIPARVVEIYPKECFQAGLHIYEDEDPETETAWEEALADMLEGMDSSGLPSYNSQTKGNKLVELLRRMDILSGIGRYGVAVIGIDDGLDLRMPAKLRPVKKSGKAGAKGKTKKSAPTPAPAEQDVELDEDAGTLASNAFPSTPIPTSTIVPDERPYVRDAEGNLVLPGKRGNPLEKMPSSLKDPSPGATRRLKWVRVFPEHYCSVSEWDVDPNSERFGRPVRYQITFGDVGRAEGATMPVVMHEVHWTRVVHQVDTSITPPINDYIGYSRQEQVLNRELDLRKVYGPDAESFYKNGIPTWAFETHPELGPPDLDKTSLKNEWEQASNSMSRLLATEGGSLKALTTSIPDPSPHIMIHIQAICVKLGCPQRIFMGSERGELASSQDDAAWNDRLRERQNTYLTPRLVCPFIDRLIALGCLPEPEAEDGYKVWWPDLESQSGSEKATIAGSRTTAMATFFDPAKSLTDFMSRMDFWTREMGYEEKEAKDIIANAEKEKEQRKKEAEEEQQKQMALQDEQARAGMERDLEFQQRQAEQQATQSVVQGIQGAQVAQRQGEAATEEQAPTLEEETGLVAAELNKQVQEVVANALKEQTRKERSRARRQAQRMDQLIAVLNVFCKTGTGGGIDPTCSIGGPKGATKSKTTGTAPVKPAVTPVATPAPAPVSTTPAQKAATPTPDPDANRPSSLENRHPKNTPAVLPWKEPPAKLGKKGQGPIERPKGDASQTKQGDIAEARAIDLGFRNILPAGKRNLTAKEVEQIGSSIDLEFDHSGKAYELKMCKTTSTEYRLKAKKEEKESKEKFAKHYKLEAYTLVGVHDVAAGKVYFYASKEPGLTGAEVSQKNFNFVGEADWD